MSSCWFFCTFHHTTLPKYSLHYPTHPYTHSLVEAGFFLGRSVPCGARVYYNCQQLWNTKIPHETCQTGKTVENVCVCMYIFVCGVYLDVSLRYKWLTMNLKLHNIIKMCSQVQYVTKWSNGLLFGYLWSRMGRSCSQLEFRSSDLDCESWTERG